MLDQKKFTTTYQRSSSAVTPGISTAASMALSWKVSTYASGEKSAALTHGIFRSNSDARAG